MYEDEGETSYVILNCVFCCMQNTVTCYAPIDNDCSRVILGNQAGKLYMLILVTKEENGRRVVEDLEIVYLGEVIASVATNTLFILARVCFAQMLF